MSGAERYKEFLSLLPTLMRGVGFSIQEQVFASLKRQFRKDDNKVFNNKDTLRKKSGALLNSFIDKNEGSTSKIDFSDGALNLQIGSNLPYAQIQETGGFVKSHGKMESFFWAKYYETKANEYKIIALSVKAKGGITIKPKNYFAKGLEDFEKNRLQKLIEKETKNILKGWEATA